jgi:type II secretion system protein G
MRTRTNRKPNAFTLIEILIVVVILGILAAIVIPQFSDASEDAATSGAQSQLQTIRSQIELFRLHSLGRLPDFANEGWDEMTDPAHAGNPNPGTRYLQQAPRNPLQANSTTIAAAAAAGVGWVWDAADEQMYAVDQTGAILTDPATGNPF